MGVKDAVLNIPILWVVKVLFPAPVTAAVSVLSTVGMLGWIPSFAPHGRKKRITRALASKSLLSRVARKLQRSREFMSLVQFWHPVAEARLLRFVLVNVLKRVFPEKMRQLTFNTHFAPIYLAYMKTKNIDACVSQTTLLKVCGVGIVKWPPRFLVKTSERAEQIWDSRHRWASKRLRRMLEELSGFYLKVGQFLASKADVLPEPIVSELRILFDNIKPDPPRIVHKTLKRELGKNYIPEKLSRINYTPIASASIAGAYIAQHHDGYEVVLKIQRHGMDKRMNSDLDTVVAVSEFLKNNGFGVDFDYTALAREYKENVPLEFDFHREMEMIKLHRKSLEEGLVASDSLKDGTTKNSRHQLEKIVLPEPIEELSTSRCLAMKRIYGETFSDLIKREGENLHLSKLHPSINDAIKSLLEFYGFMIFNAGTFHTDPHAGNLMIVPVQREGEEQEAQLEYKLALLDFGQCKEFKQDEQIISVCRVICAIASRDAAIAHHVCTQEGLEILGVEEQHKGQLFQLMFDTRFEGMEFSTSTPFDDTRLKKLNLPQLPDHLFMILRVVSILRGLMTSIDVDLSSAEIWLPFAVSALKRMNLDVPSYAIDKLKEIESSLAKLDGESTSKGGSKSNSQLSRPQSVFSQMHKIGMKFKENGIPYSRKQLFPVAVAGLHTFPAISACPEDAFDMAFRHYSATQKSTIRRLANDEANSSSDSHDGEPFAHSRNAGPVLNGAGCRTEFSGQALFENPEVFSITTRMFAFMCTVVLLYITIVAGRSGNR